MKRLAVFISKEGTGSNLQALINAIHNKTLDAYIAVVVSDGTDAKGAIIARDNNIPVHLFTKQYHLERLLKQTFPVDYMLLAGWKKIIPNSLINAFPHKIINIHPGLIPNEEEGLVHNPDGTNGLWNRGKYADKAIANFLEKKTSYAGSSVHFLTDVFDFGPVIGRTFEKIQTTDTVESLYQRLKKKEHELLIQVLQNL